MVGGRDTKEYKEMADSHSQKFDCHVRRFLVLHCPELYNPQFPTSNALSQKIRDRVFFPIISGSNPTNNFYLRFPDLGPRFPSRCIQSKAMFMELVKVSE
jgi:hypothetical protein